MPEAKISSKFLTQLENFGINPKSVHRNLSVEKLVEISTQKNEGVLTSSGFHPERRQIESKSEKKS